MANHVLTTQLTSLGLQTLRPLTICAVLAGATLSLPAEDKKPCAAGDCDREKPTPAAVFKQFDADQSGGLSLQELITAHQHRQDKRAERRDQRDDAAPQRPDRGDQHIEPAALFAKADSDGSGELSLEEFTGIKTVIKTEQFARVDNNGDGSVTPEELKTAMLARHQARKDRRDEGATGERDGKRKPKGEGKGQAEGGAQGERQGPFARIDTNQDGGISLDEWLAYEPTHRQGKHGRGPDGQQAGG